MTNLDQLLELTEQIMVLRHLAGKHNQKTHGWKYGGTQAARRAFEGATKEERETYKRRARGKAEHHALLTKDIGVIERQGNKIILSTPYSPGFVNDLKNNIVASRRNWNESARNWEIDASEEKTARGIMKEHWHVADRDKIGGQGVVDLKQRQKSARIREGQRVIRRNTDKIESRIADLKNSIDRYSFGSRSKSKADNLREKALLEYVLRDSSTRPEKMTDIQIKGLNAAIRDMGLK